jgi:DNA-binding SARP family transcriptional activator
MTNDEYISFVAGGEYWLDVELFQDAASSSQYIMGRDLTSVQVTRLEQAIELYTGDLLNDVYDDWCLYDRERLSLMYLNGLSKLMSVYEAVGNYERGIDCGKRILAKDSIRENIHLQLMKLYWMSGDRNTALLQYKRCSQILKEELGISPLIETTNTYQQMVNNQYIPNRLEGDSDIQIIPSTTIHPNAKHALQKLQHLHSMIEDASNEIKHLERLINSFLTDSEQV